MFRNFVLAMIIVILSSILVAYYVSITAATLVANFGSLLVLGIALAHIVFVHSRRRWPDLTPAQRLAKVLTLRH